MNKEELSKTVVARRVSLNVTQSQVAELSGVSVHTLSNLETGNGNVTIDTLLKVAATLGLNVRIGV